MSHLAQGSEDQIKFANTLLTKQPNPATFLVSWLRWTPTKRAERTGSDGDGQGREQRAANQLTVSLVNNITNFHRL